MNVSLAAVALVLASPLMLILALLVVASSPGPVLYVQDRVGVNRRRGLPASGDRRASDIGGQRFRIYKFRTMMVDAERETGAVWACPDDPRVTRIGRYMRRYRLDEMPQLFNVLRGEMNIVGPRPERPSIFADLCRQIPDYADRQRAMPGITGLAQIRHHYDRSVEDVLIKLAYDLDYVTNRSAWMDLRIMAATLPAVLFRARGW